LAAAIRFHRDASDVRAAAASVAQITNGYAGVEAAVVMAAGIATAVAGGTVEQVYEAARASVESDSWLGRNIDLASRILEDAGSAWVAGQ